MSSFRVFKGCRALMAATTKGAGTTSGAKVSVPTKQPRPAARTSGILRMTPVSPALRKFLGASEASRADAVKKIWEHIKKNNLQNPADKREIYCDEKLKTIFDGKEKVGFLEIGRLLSPHFVKTG